MQPLDAPIDLKYSGGKLFPGNAVFSGYIFLVIGTFSLLMGAWIIGLGLLLLGSFIGFSWADTVVDPTRKEFSERTFYCGFIPVIKTMSTSKWQLVTVIPKRETQTMYARSSTSTSITDVYFVVTLLRSNYRGKKELARFENRHRSYEIAKGLSEQLDLEYFEYDPRVIRDAYRR